MDIRVFTALSIDPSTDKGKNKALGNVPALPGSKLPEQGLLFYHISANPLLLAVRDQMLEAIAKGHILATFRVMLKGFTSPGDVANRGLDAKAKTNTQYMTYPDLPNNDILFMNRVSAELRDKMISIFAEGATNTQRKKLEGIIADRYFHDYIRMYPESIDKLHAHPEFKHLRAISFPTSLTVPNANMVVLYSISPDDVEITAMHDTHGVNVVLPNTVLDDQLSRWKDIVNTTIMTC